MNTPFNIRRHLRDLPIQKKMTLIIALYSIVMAGFMQLSYIGMEVMSSDRAFVQGEGLWSKAQKQATVQLGRYAWSRNEEEYDQFLAALAIPLGDKQARLELEKIHPDYNAASTGFERGGNHPKDIPGMIHLFRWFRHVSYMDQAIAIWSQGDDDIIRLQIVGAQIHWEMTHSRSSLIHLQKLLVNAQEINMHLTPLENAFSSTLGEGARWLKKILLIVMGLSACIFLLIGIFGANYISRQLIREINALKDSAARMAGGDYSLALEIESNDEVGDLARSFQQMVIQRQEADRLMRRHAIDVETANKELEAFSYSVSHDLRAPLRAIDGFSSELEQNCLSLLDERSRQDLRRIRAATQRMAQLIDDLLELSRLSRSDLQREAVDLSALAQEIVLKLREADNPRRSVDFMAVPLLVCEGDRRLLQIALENLIQNAWKFSSKAAHAKIELGVLRRGEERIFFVRDNGVGFDMAYSDKLFKPFQRLHDAKEFPGTGIGLALVSLSDHSPAWRPDLGGRGRGTGGLFLLYSSRGDDMNAKVVLLVEDNDDDIELTLRSFKKNNLSNRIDVARNGQEALQYLAGKKSSDDLPVLILLDLKLPKVDGLEVLRHIRANPLTKYIPVVILTTSSQTMDKIHSYDGGANSYVRKPVDFDHFVEATRQLGIYWLMINDPPPVGESRF